MKRTRILLMIGLLFSALFLIKMPNAKAQVTDECETMVYSGTATFLPEDPIEFECQGIFTNCTEVIIICDPL